jgi:hypothetical protein
LLRPVTSHHSRRNRCPEPCRAAVSSPGGFSRQGPEANLSKDRQFLVRDLSRHKNLAMTGPYVNRADSPVRTLSDQAGDALRRGWQDRPAAEVVPPGHNCRFQGAYGRPRKARFTNGCSLTGCVACCRLRSARSSHLSTRSSRWDLLPELDAPAAKSNACAALSRYSSCLLMGLTPPFMKVFAHANIPGRWAFPATRNTVIRIT